ncbi:MAG: hypothetical protein AAB131_10020 [Actinomycetota bacterium]
MAFPQAFHQVVDVSFESRYRTSRFVCGVFPSGDSARFDASGVCIANRRMRSIDVRDDNVKWFGFLGVIPTAASDAPTARLEALPFIRTECCQTIELLIVLDDRTMATLDPSAVTTGSMESLEYRLLLGAGERIASPAQVCDRKRLLSQCVAGGLDEPPCHPLHGDADAVVDRGPDGEGAEGANGLRVVVPRTVRVRGLEHHEYGVEEDRQRDPVNAPYEVNRDVLRIRRWQLEQLRVGLRGEPESRHSFSCRDDFRDIDLVERSQ